MAGVARFMLAKRLAVTESGWEHEFWALEGWQVLQAKGDTAAAQDFFQTTSAPAEISDKLR